MVPRAGLEPARPRGPKDFTRCPRFPEGVDYLFISAIRAAEMPGARVALSPSRPSRPPQAQP